MSFFGSTVVSFTSPPGNYSLFVTDCEDTSGILKKTLSSEKVKENAEEFFALSDVPSYSSKIEGKIPKITVTKLPFDKNIGNGGKPGGKKINPSAIRSAQVLKPSHATLKKKTPKVIDRMTNEAANKAVSCCTTETISVPEKYDPRFFNDLLVEIAQVIQENLVEVANALINAENSQTGTFDEKNKIVTALAVCFTRHDDVELGANVKKLASFCNNFVRNIISDVGLLSARTRCDIKKNIHEYTSVYYEFRKSYPNLEKNATPLFMSYLGRMNIFDLGIEEIEKFPAPKKSKCYSPETIYEVKKGTLMHVDRGKSRGKTGRFVRFCSSRNVVLLKDENKQFYASINFVVTFDDTEDIFNKRSLSQDDFVFSPN